MNQSAQTPQRKLSRRLVLKLAAACAIPSPTAWAVDDVHTNTSQERAKRGRQFLAGLLDESMGLLPEYSGAKVYWLYHDNYLAAKVLKKAEPDIARRIESTIESYGVRGSGKIEILFDEAVLPLPFRHYELMDVKQVDEKRVKTERVTQRAFSGWEQYADLRFFAAISLARSEHDGAKRNLDAGVAMWNAAARGFEDRSVNDNRIYSTYKLALALLAAQRLKVKLDMEKEVIQRLVELQAKSGGWITDYTAEGKAVGLANVETTSLAVMALEG